MKLPWLTRVLLIFQVVFIVILLIILAKEVNSPALAGLPGKDGYTPVKGLDYADGIDGRDGRDGKTIVGPAGPPGESIVGPQGPVGPQGEPGIQGEPGADGRNIETRCVQTDNGARHDWRYEGDLSWQPDYYLPEGSTCA